ncbi:MAG TPA: hypothetical protein VJ793_09215 [Anaerolineae bacterium]|nr:hypothetical protein [Anaerolineae bacterium]
MLEEQERRGDIAEADRSRAGSQRGELFDLVCLRGSIRDGETQREKGVIVIQRCVKRELDVALGLKGDGQLLAGAVDALDRIM